MVVKNLAKDPLFYTKDGMFGTKGVGYTTETPGLGQPEEPKGKYKSSGYGDLDADIKIEKVKSNVQDSLSDKEAKTTNPSKVKEMEVTPKSASGIKRMPMPGAEKKMKLQENINILENKDEQKLRSLIRNVIKEALDENVDEATYQSSVNIGGKAKGSGGRRSIPDTPELSKSAYKKLENTGDIIQTKDNKLAVSDMFLQYVSSSTKGRSAEPITARRAGISREIMPMLREPRGGALFINLIKRLAQSKLTNKPVIKGGQKYNVIPYDYFDAGETYKFDIPKEELEEILAEELTESYSDKDIQIKYNEMFNENPSTTFVDVAKALNIPEDQAYSTLIAPMGGISIREQKLRSLIRNVIKEALNK
jgi:hypothetical protein